MLSSILVIRLLSILSMLGGTLNFIIANQPTDLDILFKRVRIKWARKSIPRSLHRNSSRRRWIRRSARNKRRQNLRSANSKCVNSNNNDWRMRNRRPTLQLWTCFRRTKTYWQVNSMTILRRFSKKIKKRPWDTIKSLRSKTKSKTATLGTIKTAKWKINRKSTRGSRKRRWDGFELPSWRHKSRGLI